MTRIRTAPVAMLIAALLTPAGVASSEPQPRATGGGAVAQTTSAIAQPRFLPSFGALPEEGTLAPLITPGDDPGTRGPVRVGSSDGGERSPGRAPVPSAITPTEFSSPSINIAGTPGLFPPDPIGDVGPDHYVQAVNVSVQMYDKTGVSVAGPTTLGTFFSSLGPPCNGNAGDPVVIYDQLAGRWLIAQFADSPNRLCVGVSTTDDPTGAFNLYQFVTPQFPDYFKIGAWPDAYYVTWNQGSVGVAALERSEMLTGSPAEIVTTSVAGHLGANMMLPADADGATPPPLGAPGLIYHHKDAAIAGGSDRIELRTVTPAFNGSPSAIVVSVASAIPVSSFDGNFCGGFEFTPCIPQPGTSNKLDPIMEWPMWRLQYRNFGTHETLLGNFLTDVDGTDRAGIRWFELRRTPPATSGAWSLHQEGTHSPDATHRWMGSIAMDGEGNVALGYSASDATSTYPSAWYAGRVEDDLPGTLPRGEVELFPGNTPETACQNLGGGVCIGRWGDYASMNVDPVDDCTFWFTGELARVGAGRETRIGAFSLCDTLTVFMAGSGSGTVTSSPGGISCPTDCVEGYGDGDMVQLTASAAGDGSFFDGWSGGGCGMTSPCTVTVNEATNVTATFTDAAKTLTVTTSGSGSGTVNSNPAGIACEPTCIFEFPTDDPVTLTHSAGAGSAFTVWSGDCIGTADCNLVMSEDRTVDANFELVHDLAVSVTGLGTGTVTSTPAGIACPPTCSTQFVNGVIVNLNASPGPDSEFLGWSDDCSGAGACSVTMTQDRSVSGSFGLLPVLNVSLAGSGKGTVTSSPSGVSCPGSCTARFPRNSVVGLTPGAAKGSWFAGWSGACAGTGGCDVSMSQDQGVTATFEPSVMKSVNVKASKKKVPAGEKVRLTAKVTPCAGNEGDPVQFQMKKGGWKKVATKATNAKCVAKVKRKIKKTTRFRALSPQQSDQFLAGRSKPVRVRAI